MFTKEAKEYNFGGVKIKENLFLGDISAAEDK